MILARLKEIDQFSIRYAYEVNNNFYRNIAVLNLACNLFKTTQNSKITLYYKIRHLKPKTKNKNKNKKKRKQKNLTCCILRTFVLNQRWEKLFTYAKTPKFIPTGNIENVPFGKYCRLTLWIDSLFRIHIQSQVYRRYLARQRGTRNLRSFAFYRFRQKEVLDKTANIAENKTCQSMITVKITSNISEAEALCLDVSDMSH